MLKDLVAYLGSEPDADSFARIDAVKFEDDGCSLRLSASKYLEEWTEWTIKAEFLHEHSIEKPHGDFWLVEKDHALARQFTDTQQDLSFRGIPQSASAVVGELSLAHRTELKDWVPFLGGI